MTTPKQPDQKETSGKEQTPDVAPAPHIPAKRTGERRSYLEEDYQRGLHEVALCAGNTAEAARRLEARDQGIPEKTLRDWVTKSKTREYEDIRLRLVPQIQATIAKQCEDVATAAAYVEGLLLERMANESGDLKPSDLGGSLRNVSTTKGINLDKAKLYRGEATERVEHSTDEVLAGLARRGIRVELAPSYDSTAEEIPPAEALTR